jgi:hypothetical protein
MKIEGTIKQIKPSEKDIRRLSLLIDKDWFSLFTIDGKTNLKISDMIEAEYSIKGNFKNIDINTIKVIGKSIVTEIVNNIRSDTSRKIEQQAMIKAAAIYSKTPEENIKNAKVLYKSLKEDWN